MEPSLSAAEPAGQPAKLAGQAGRPGADRPTGQFPNASTACGASACASSALLDGKPEYGSSAWRWFALPRLSVNYPPNAFAINLSPPPPKAWSHMDCCEFIGHRIQCRCVNGFLCLCRGVTKLASVNICTTAHRAPSNPIMF